MITVRRAQSTDIAALMHQLRHFDVFFGAGRSLMPRDENHAVVLLQSLIAQHVFYVAIDSGESDVAGFIAGHLAAHGFNPDIRTLTELFWWVEPPYRGSRAGSLLLDAYVDDGKRRADWVLMTLEHDSPVNDRVLLKRGFRMKERSYLLEVAA